MKLFLIMRTYIFNFLKNIMIVFSEVCEHFWNVTIFFLNVINIYLKLRVYTFTLYEHF